MLIEKKFILWQDRNDLTTPYYYEVIEWFKSTGLFIFDKEEINNPESVSNTKKTYLKIKNIDYILLVEIYNYVDQRGLRISFCRGDNVSNIIGKVFDVAKKGSEAGEMPLSIRMIVTENLYFFKTFSYGTGGANGSYYAISRFNDNKFRFIFPFVDELLNLSYDKTFFSKLSNNNSHILIPARLKTGVNKLLNIYPLSCFYTSGLINETFYKFLDGEYGYYKDNILYK